MNTKMIIAALACLPLSAVGCDGDDAGHVDECPELDAGSGTDPDAGTVEVHRHEYGISMEAGHVHAHRDAAITFTVRDLDDCTDPADETTCAPVPGLIVEVHRFHEDSTAPRVQEMEPGVLDDMGDGTYTWIRNFADVGGYSIGLSFMHDDHHYMAAFPLHVSQAGGERIFCGPTDTPDYAFQVRWSNSPGHVHAEGGDATFDVELLRSFNTPVNTEQPWMNQFDHLTPSSMEAGALPTFEILDSSGAVAKTPDVEYIGRGVYRLTTSFVEADLGGEPEGHFNIQTTFTDVDGCSVDESGEEYEFRVAAGH